MENLFNLDIHTINKTITKLVEKAKQRTQQRGYKIEYLCKAVVVTEIISSKCSCAVCKLPISDIKELSLDRIISVNMDEPYCFSYEDKNFQIAHSYCNTEKGSEDVLNRYVYMYDELVTKIEKLQELIKKYPGKTELHEDEVELSEIQNQIRSLHRMAGVDINKLICKKENVAKELKYFCRRRRLQPGEIDSPIYYETNCIICKYENMVKKVGRKNCERCGKIFQESDKVLTFPNHLLSMEQRITILNFDCDPFIIKQSDESYIHSKCDYQDPHFALAREFVQEIAELKIEWNTLWKNASKEAKGEMKVLFPMIINATIQLHQLNAQLSYTKRKSDYSNNRGIKVRIS